MTKYGMKYAIRGAVAALVVGQMAGLGIGTNAGLPGAAPASAQLFSDGFEFMKAVRERDGDTVMNLLDQPGNTLVNSRDLATGQTAMHIVVERRDLTWVRYLRGKGANVDIADKKGVTPLQIASNLGFVEGVEELLKGGARVDQGNAAGETPLIAAIHRRDVAMVRLLLANGANPDLNDNSGRSARDYASLMTGGRLIVDAIAQTDASRGAGADTETYGPSL